MKGNQFKIVPAQNQIRTGDTRIFNPLLYQLSYPGLNLTIPYFELNSNIIILKIKLDF